MSPARVGKAFATWCRRSKLERCSMTRRQCHRTPLCVASKPRSAGTFCTEARAATRASEKSLSTCCSNFFFSTNFALARSDSFSSSASRMRPSFSGSGSSSSPGSSFALNASNLLLKSAKRSSYSLSISSKFSTLRTATSCLHLRMTAKSGRRRALTNKFCRDRAVFISSLISSASMSPNHVPSMMHAPQCAPKTSRMAAT
mmetsp:Transcript_120531/g.257370  ORF Transcript_120531/g.257370 Transcript_120531/m.257370 type:complete len:201 (+) Transcript_120531:1853-2455(+)